MAQRRDRAFWERLVREVGAGASQATVATRHGVSTAWLGMWCRKIRSAEGSRGALLPVRVVEQRARRVELIIGAARLAFEEGTDPRYVAELARRLTQ